MDFQLLKSREEARSFSAPALRLVNTIYSRPDATFTPEYLLARTADRHEPRIVACYESGELVGAIYGYEIMVGGRPTGYVFGGDETGRGLVLAAAEREGHIVASASRYLLERGIHAMRFNWRVNGVSDDVGLRGLEPARISCTHHAREFGDLLTLGADYETFLCRLGVHTRRNMRLYRRKAEAEGYRFCPELHPEEYWAAAERLNRITDYPVDPLRQERDRRFLTLFDSLFLAGVQDSSGSLVSIIAGVVQGDHLHVITQLNDASKQKFSLSLVLRGYVIETLINKGFSDIHFVNGSSAMLGRFCEPLEVRILSIDRNDHSFALLKSASSRIAARLHQHGRRVPNRLQYFAGSYLAERSLAAFAPNGFSEHIL